MALMRSPSHKISGLSTKSESRIKSLTQKLDAQIAINNCHEDLIKKLQLRSESLEIKLKEKTISENNARVKLSCIEREILDYRKVLAQKNTIIQKLRNSCESASETIKTLDIRNQELSKLSSTNSDRKLSERNKALLLEVLQLKRIIHASNLMLTPKVDVQVQTNMSSRKTEPATSDDYSSSDVFNELSLNSSEKSPFSIGNMSHSQSGGSAPIRSFKSLQPCCPKRTKSLSESNLNSMLVRFGRDSKNFPDTNRIQNQKPCNKLDVSPMVKQRSKLLIASQSNNSNNHQDEPPNHTKLIDRMDGMEIIEISGNLDHLLPTPRRSNKIIIDSLAMVVDKLKNSDDILAKIIETRLSSLKAINA